MSLIHNQRLFQFRVNVDQIGSESCVHFLFFRCQHRISMRKKTGTKDIFSQEDLTKVLVYVNLMDPYRTRIKSFIMLSMENLDNEKFP